MYKEMDFALGYFTVFPSNFRDPTAPKNEPYLFISKRCPADLKARLLETWPRVYKETKERHARGIYSSKDYF